MNPIQNERSRTTAPENKYSWFFWFLAVYTAFQMCWFAVLVFDFLRNPLAPDAQNNSVAYRLFVVLVVVPLALVISTLVLHRARGNVVGLCLLLWSVTIMGGTLPASSPLALYDGVINGGWMGLWLLGIFFPNGRTAFPRAERWIQLLCVACLVTVVTWPLFQPPLASPNGGTTFFPNPFSVPALVPLQPIANVVEFALLIAVVLLILPSFFVRYRRGDERTRLQLRWLGAAFFLVIAIALALLPSGIMQNGPDLTRDGLVGILAFFFFGIYLSLFPYIAVGNAILRHRLFDIDIIIRRTVTYAIVGALLAIVYFGSVILLQQIFAGITGQRSEPITILSTLAIAVLFVPLRNRIQDAIDKRFNRKKYDAQKVLQKFSETVRDETDLDKLVAELVKVVQETMEPRSVSVWLRKADGGRRTGDDVETFR